jgi:hypothetical protein
MIRQRRSLWASISTSKKVNKVSMPAALLYTWAISHFDDEGLQEADPKYLKHEIVPYREDLPIEAIKPLIIELVKIGLWNIYYTKDNAFIEDPVFFERQPMGGIHKIPSKIKPLLKGIRPSMFVDTPNGVRVHTEPCLPAQPTVPKRSEVKLREEKRSEGEFVSFVSEKIKSPSKTLDPTSRREELRQQAEALGVK